MAKVGDPLEAVWLGGSVRLHSTLDVGLLGAAPPALPVMLDEPSRDAREAAPRDVEQSGGPDRLRIPRGAGLRSFKAQVIVFREIAYTIVGGRFSPTLSIDPTHQDVILSVYGTENLRLSVSAGLFSVTGLGGYVASDKSGSFPTDILLQPFSGGDWAYSVGIRGFVPASTSVIIRLRIGSQAGKTSAKAAMF